MTDSGKEELGGHEAREPHVTAQSSSRRATVGLSSSDDAIPVIVQRGESLLSRVRLLGKSILTNELLLVSGALALLVVLYFHDIVFLGRTLTTSSFMWGVMGDALPFGYPGDTPDYNKYILDPLASSFIEPLIQTVSNSYWNLQLPLWDAHEALGKPLSSHLPALSPYHLPLVLSSSPAAWDIFLLARFFVAGLFTYLFAKRLGIGRIPAFGAAVAYMFSGYFMLYVNMPQPDFLMLIPVLLYAFEGMFERPTAGRILFAAAAVSVVPTAGNPQPTVLLLLFGTAYYLARMLTAAHVQGGTGLLRRSLPLGLTLATGVGLNAVLLLPFLELTGSLGQENLSINRHTSEAIGVKFTPLRHLVSLFIPYFDGSPVGGFQGPGWSGIRNYVGVVVPLLAFLGLWNRRLLVNGGWFFGIAAVLVLAKMYGAGIINWVGVLPVLNVIDFAQYLPPAATFSIVILAAMGLDQLSAGRVRGWHVLLGLAVLTLVIGWLVWLNRATLGNIPTVHLAVQLGAASTLAIAAAAVILGVSRRSISGGTACIVLIALVGAELFAFTLPVKGDLTGAASAVYGRDLPVIERPQRYDPFTEPPFVSFLKEDESEYRVFALDRLLYGGTSGVYGLDDIRSFGAITVRRYFRFIESFISPTARLRFTGAYLPPSRSETEPTAYAANPMFNLLNVKYLITRRGLTELYDHSLADTIRDNNEEGPNVGLKVFQIDEEEEAVLFEHPPQSLSHTFTPDEESKFLLFRLALDPDVWQPSKGDGVLFEVSVREGERNEVLFSRWVDPKNNAADRSWIDGAVDLRPFLGQPLTLVLSTSAGETNSWDWAGWGALRLSPLADTPPIHRSPDQYELVYDNDVMIYENHSALPRAFVVHRVARASGPDQAVELMKQPDFDPSKQAVVEGEPPPEQLVAIARTPIADASSVEIVRYGDNSVKLLARMENPGFVVLSDTYYPGWRAYVDGKETPVYPTDLALRSVFLPAGEHEVEFVFSPSSFKLGLAISAASLAVLLGYVAWGPASRAFGGWIGSRRRGP